MQSWLQVTLDLFWPCTVHSVEAFEKWPGSTSPKETAARVWKGKETTWFEEIARPEGGMARFRDSMKLVGSGEGWETKYLAEEFPWGTIGSGTVVDVSSVHL